MNPVVAALLIVGLYLVMESVADKRVETAVARTALEKENERERSRDLSTCLYEQQLSGNGIRDYVKDMIEDTGPWMYRDNDDTKGMPGSAPEGFASSVPASDLDWMQARAGEGKRKKKQRPRAAGAASEGPRS